MEKEILKEDNNNKNSLISGSVIFIYSPTAAAFESSRHFYHHDLKLPIHKDKGSEVFYKLNNNNNNNNNNDNKEAAASSCLGVVREGGGALDNSGPCSVYTRSGAPVSASDSSAKSVGSAGGVKQWSDTVMICLLTQHVQQCFDRILQNKDKNNFTEVIRFPQRNDRYGIFHALVRDPNGYIVELQQFLDDEEHFSFTGKNEGMQ